MVTLLEESLRTRFDAATEDAFDSVHATSVAEAIKAVREHIPTALVVSSGASRNESMTAMANLVARSPGVTPVALLTTERPDDSVLALGSCGFRHLLDLDQVTVWGRLRSIAENPGSGATPVIMTAVMAELDGASDDARRVFGTIVREAPITSTTRELAAKIRVHHSTLTSRFFRERLPTPKRYLASMRLVYASAFLELPRASIADVAYKLRFSSPQSFGRAIRTTLGITATEFRRNHCFAATLDHFVGSLITPYLEELKHFHPLRTPDGG